MAPVQTDSRLSPIALRMLAELEDGEWHDQEDVIDAAQYLMPPGEAFRHGKRRSNAPDLRTQADIIATGRRQKTMSLLNGLIQNGRVERDTSERGKPKKVRLIEDRQQPVVYVVRDGDGNLSVETLYTANTVSIQIIDAWAQSANPKEDLEKLKTVFEALPYRIPNRERIQSVCRDLMNRLSVASVTNETVTRDLPAQQEEPEPKEHSVMVEEENPSNFDGGTSSVY